MGTRRNALVGAFVVAGLVLFAVGLFLIGDRRLLFTPSFELTTTFTKVSGLQVGTTVRVAGLDAGEVLAIALPSRPSEPFRVRMRLREDLRPLIRDDSVCVVQTDGIVGSTFVQVGRGTDASPVVSPGGTITGVDPVEFADLIQEGRQTFRLVAQEIGEFSDDMSSVVGGLNDITTSTNDLIADVGADIKQMSAAGVRLAADGEGLMGEANDIIAGIRRGEGTIGKLLTDDAMYASWDRIMDDAGETVNNLRRTTENARDMVESLGAPEGATQRIVQSLRDTLTDTREVMSDLSESTEALKRNVLFRGFFQDRGFFDLDAISREAYVAGALEGADRTALRVWIDGRVLFAAAPDGYEQLTDDGRRRIDSAMSDLMRYPRDSPLVVEGYADGSEGGSAYLVSHDRAQAVRDYLLTRFRRQVTLTGVMPMAADARLSPRDDGRWSGVALTLFVRTDALGRGR